MISLLLALFLACTTNDTEFMTTSTMSAQEQGEWTIEPEPGDLDAMPCPWDQQVDEQYDIYYIDGENIEKETSQNILEKVCDLIATTPK
ncbi:MAG: hypothetical protein ABSB40_12185 [Nitrososphaeria archaeon]|jgi:hypothetical protein